MEKFLPQKSVAIGVFTGRPLSNGFLKKLGVIHAL